MLRKIARIFGNINGVTISTNALVQKANGTSHSKFKNK